MKYLFLLNSVRDGMPPAGTPESDALYEEWNEATDAMKAAGVLIDCAPLHAQSASTTVRVREGETILTDGPAAEIKEHLGGYALVECADLDEALRWAASVPAARKASVVVRPIVTVQEPA